jgi:hypothetical protein
MKVKNSTLMIVLLVLVFLFFVMRSSGYDATPAPATEVPVITVMAPTAVPVVTAASPEQKFNEFLGAVRDSLTLG